MEPIYFVYIIELHDGTPLYVGKGKDSRPLAHYSPKATSYIANKLRKVGGYSQTKIRKFCEHLTSEEAYKLEIELIQKYGRKDINTGILYNRSDGGEGSKGHKMTTAGIEKLRLLNTGKHLSLETKKIISQALVGREHTWGEKIKASLTGKPHTDERKENLSLAAKQRYESMSEQDKAKLKDHMKKMSHSVDRTKPNPMARRCEILGQQFNNVSEAAEKLGWSRKRIRGHASFKYSNS